VQVKPPTSVETLRGHRTPRQRRRDPWRCRSPDTGVDRLPTGAERDGRACVARRVGSWGAAALALAVELQADVVLIDERRVRVVTSRLGLNVVGVLGVVVEAKHKALGAASQTGPRRLNHSGRVLGQSPVV
jgi:hypothetical protein